MKLILLLSFFIQAAEEDPHFREKRVFFLECVLDSRYCDDAACDYSLEREYLQLTGKEGTLNCGRSDRCHTHKCIRPCVDHCKDHCTDYFKAQNKGSC